MDHGFKFSNGIEHMERNFLKTAVTLTHYIKQDAWALLDQNDFKDVSINGNFTEMALNPAMSTHRPCEIRNKNILYKLRSPWRYFFIVYLFLSPHQPMTLQKFVLIIPLLFFVKCIILPLIYAFLENMWFYFVSQLYF